MGWIFFWLFPTPTATGEIFFLTIGAIFAALDFSTKKTTNVQKARSCLYNGKTERRHEGKSGFNLRAPFEQVGIGEFFATLHNYLQ